MTHTFSFMGSFEAKHNPQWWWIFSIAMTFWGVATVPLVFYLYRRFALISPWGAPVGLLLFLTGCAGIVGVAMFPDARGNVIGNFEWTEIHEKAAVTVAAAFTLGILWHGILLLKDRLSRRGRSGHSAFDHRKLLWPYLFWTVMFGISVYHLAAWERIYAARKAAALAAGTPIGSSWSEALNTRYSFPLWENILIYTLFIFLMWFILAVPRNLEPTPTCHCESHTAFGGDIAIESANIADLRSKMRHFLSRNERVLRSAPAKEDPRVTRQSR
jgi:hypothetical protein